MYVHNETRVTRIQDDPSAVLFSPFSPSLVLFPPPSKFSRDRQICEILRERPRECHKSQRTLPPILLPSLAFRSWCPGYKNERKREEKRRRRTYEEETKQQSQYVRDREETRREFYVRELRTPRLHNIQDVRPILHFSPRSSWEEHEFGKTMSRVPVRCFGATHTHTYARKKRRPNTLKNWTAQRSNKKNERRSR